MLLDVKPNLGPTEDEAADFEKELSKILSDAAADAKKVDRKAAMSAWDAAVTPAGAVARRKRDVDKEQEPDDIMKFTVLTKRANKNPVCVEIWAD